VNQVHEPLPEQEEDRGPAHIAIPLQEDVHQKFRTIVEICHEVSRAMKKGYSEGVYEQAVCIELQERNIHYTQQEILPLMYKNCYIGLIRLDILLTSWLPFILELKAKVGVINSEEKWQLVRYMQRKGVPYGAVVNFSQSMHGHLQFGFVVQQGETYYQYNLETGMGKELMDYS
jgi:GxxExxY protein